MKKNLVREVAILIVSIMLLTSLVSCGPSQSQTSDTSEVSTAPADSQEPEATPEEVTLTFWHTYSEGSGGEEETFLNEVVPKFESANPGIKINAVKMPLDGLQEQVVTAVAGDAAPDVMRMDNSWVSGMAKLGALKPLSSLDGFDAIKANALSAPMDTNYYDGDYYGLPLNTNTTTAVWNMDLLSEFGATEPPKTIDELVALAKAANKPEEEKWVFTIAGTYTWATLPWFWSLGGKLTSDDYSVASGYLNSEASVQALDTIANWYKEGVISPAIIGQEPGAWGGMTGGNYAMISEGPWFFSSFDSSFNTQTTLMPSGAGGSVSIVGGEDVVMLSTTKHEEAAWKFMQYLLSDEAQLAMTKAGMIPTINSAMESMDTSAAPYLQAYLDQLKTAAPRTPCANWTQIDQLLTNTFESVIRGEATAKDALDAAAPQVDELLK